MKTQSIFPGLEKNRLDIYQMNIVRGGNKGGGSTGMDEDILIPDPVDGDDDTTT